MAARVANPFTFGDLALDEAFTDREAELEALGADLRNGRNVVILRALCASLPSSSTWTG